MSGAYKTLKKSDVQIFAYPANKLWTANTSSYSSLGIKIFVGQNVPGDFISATDPITSDSASGDTEYRRQIYNVIKQLYYSNFLSASYQVNSSSFDNCEQSTIVSQITAINSSSYQTYYNSTVRFFPTGSNSIIRILAIPQDIFGSKIVPGTFNITSSGYNITDDKEGNLFDGQALVGNIIYPHGFAIITNPSYSLIFPTASSDSFTPSVVQKSGSFNLSFKGEHIIFENEIRCSIGEDEYNYTLNPSISSDNSGSLRGFATGSYFNPYVTTVGLYNEKQELLAVGKLGQAMQIPRNSDATFVIRWDN